MKRTTVKLPDDLDARLRHLAERRGVRLSTVVREAIAEYVGRRRPRSFGAGASGRSDISERIEEILAEKSRGAKG
ncbi:MAG: CopG family transcriptional regulator [Planctomycetota bacterium]